MGHRILRLELNADTCKGPRHDFDIPEANSDGRPTKLDNITDFADTDSAGDIVGLHFLGAAPVDSRAFVSDKRVAERSPHHTRPHQFVGCDCGRRADVGFRIKSQTKEFQYPAHPAYE